MSGGSRRITSMSPKEKRKTIDKSISKTLGKAFETELANEIDKILSEYNERDKSINEYLDNIKDIIDKEIGKAVELRFGGSVRKKTYVNGLSDIDVLIIIDKASLSGLSAAEVLSSISSILKSELKNYDNITKGEMAVTISYKDGNEIQVLPAIKDGKGIKIPSSNGKQWSNIIRPDKFAEKLTEVNKSLNNNVIPAIKLVKGIVSQFPKDQQLKGYHIESMAIEAFKRYPESKSKTTKALLKHFFEKSGEIVKSPIKDKTGQSINVDKYLDQKNSKERLKISKSLQKIYEKMEKADKLCSKEEWLRIIGE